MISFIPVPDPFTDPLPLIIITFFNNYIFRRRETGAILWPELKSRIKTCYEKFIVSQLPDQSPAGACFFPIGGVAKRKQNIIPTKGYQLLIPAILLTYSPEAAGPL